ncbi:MAG: hypothetical protein E7166_03130 [Firmicutes bacterium]|nr:hypothetical protein [Bacillota bacterium]
MKLCTNYRLNLVSNLWIKIFKKRKKYLKMGFHFEISPYTDFYVKYKNNNYMVDLIINKNKSFLKLYPYKNNEYIKSYYNSIKDFDKIIKAVIIDYNYRISRKN